MGSYWNQLTWNQSGPLNVSLRLNEYAQALVSESSTQHAEPQTTRSSEAFLVVTIRCYRQDPDRCDRATYGIGLMLDKKAELNASTNYRWTQPCACPSTICVCWLV